MTEIKKLIEQGKFKEAEKLVLESAEVAERLFYNNAISYLEEAVKLKPDDAVIHFTFGYAYSGIGDYDRAIEAYNKAIKLKPDDPVTHYNLGTVYRKQGDYDRAIEAYKMVIKLKPDFPYAHDKLNLAYTAKGGYEGGNKS